MNMETSPKRYRKSIDAATYKGFRDVQNQVSPLSRFPLP